MQSLIMPTFSSLVWVVQSVLILEKNNPLFIIAAMTLVSLQFFFALLPTLMVLPVIISELIGFESINEALIISEKLNTLPFN